MITNNKSVMITGGNHRNDRQSEDFYPSTPECTYSFLHMEREYLKGMKILEPCCGDGAISKLLIEDGFDVTSTDLVYRGYGEGGIDFLWTTETDCDAIVTNPPFKLADKFIIHAFEVLEVKYLALLLKATYWHAKSRIGLFEKYPPAVVYPMTWRPDFLKRGAPTMDFMWVVWRKSDVDGTLYKQMNKISK